MNTATENLRQTGLSCPKCGCRDLRAYYTRPRKDHILRKRICRYCGKKIVTREKISG